MVQNILVGRGEGALVCPVGACVGLHVVSVFISHAIVFLNLLSYLQRPTWNTCTATISIRVRQSSWTTITARPQVGISIGFIHISIRAKILIKASCLFTHSHLCFQLLISRTVPVGAAVGDCVGGLYKRQQVATAYVVLSLLYASQSSQESSY